jgi:hypothetical protein
MAMQFFLKLYFYLAGAEGCPAAEAGGLYQPVPRGRHLVQRDHCGEAAWQLQRAAGRVGKKKPTQKNL